MKRMIQCICILLVAVTLFPTTVMAAEVPEERASSYFLGESCYLYQKMGTEFEVWIEAYGVGTMDVIGARTIKVQRSTDGKTWKTVETRTMDSYPDMVGKGTGYHDYHFLFVGEKGYSYRAYVDFYAKKGTGSASLDRYTTPLDF